jgi:hypothetical protein
VNGFLKTICTAWVCRPSKCHGTVKTSQVGSIQNQPL